MQVGGESQFACHVAQDALEEGIDGLHSEVRVVMQDGSECLTCPSAYLRDGERRTSFFQTLHDGIHIGLCLRQIVFQAIERFQDAALHLCCRLVGEGHGQGMLELMLCMRHQ